MDASGLRQITLLFYANGNGGEPVRDWLKSLPVEERHVIGQDLMHAQWRWPVGMPLCRHLGQGLSEVRSSLPGNPGYRFARVLICYHGDCLVALHGFIKKTRATPDDDLALARKRYKELT